MEGRELGSIAKVERERESELLQTFRAGCMKFELGSAGFTLSESGQLLLTASLSHPLITLITGEQPDDRRGIELATSRVLIVRLTWKSRGVNEPHSLSN